MINQYEDKRKEKFLENLLENCGNISEACYQTNISRNLFYKWKQEDGDFYEDWEDTIRYLNELKEAYYTQVKPVYHNINK